MRFEREISRIVSFKTLQNIAVRGTIQKLSRRNVVFEVYDPFLFIRTSEVLSDLHVRSGKQLLYRGDAVVTGVVSTSILIVVSATLIGDWAELEPVDLTSQRFEKEAGAFVERWEHAHRLNPAYQLRVSELRSFLSDLRYWLDQVDLAAEAENDDDIPLLDDAFEELKAPLVPKFTELFMGLETACRQLGPDEVDNHKRLAQRDLLPLMMPSPFFNRVFTKPLGYAGDYQMVNMMYVNQRAGKTTYAKFVDDWLLSGGPPEAHRNRIVMLEKSLAEIAENAKSRNKQIRILNIGCGPAQELQKFLANENVGKRLALDLLDFNPETLEFAKQQLGAVIDGHSEKPTITYHLKSVQDLLRQAIERRDTVEAYDFIYCAGLFDYLSDRVCSKLVKLFYHWCEPGGRVLVTNVHSSNPVKGLMEHVMEWHLILRDEQDMLRLAPDPDRARVYKDATGINVFLEVYKPS